MRTIKEDALQLVRSLPDDVNWEDVLYAVYVRRMIEAGLKDADEGRVVPHEEVKRRIALWVQSGRPTVLTTGS